MNISVPDTNQGGCFAVIFILLIQVYIYQLTMVLNVLYSGFHDNVVYITISYKPGFTIYTVIVR